MIVVCDTSPLNYLLRLDCLSLLNGLYGTVRIPPAVAVEFSANRSEAEMEAVLGKDWMIIQSPSAASLRLLLREGLDAGETEAIALSLDLSASWVLIDERPATKVAKAYNLKPKGTLGVLIEAKQNGIIHAVTPYLLQLRDQTNFHFTPELFAQAVQLAAE